MSQAGKDSDLYSEEHVRSTRTALQAAREAYSNAISQRSGSQRKVNELLQRKHNWSPQDLEQFTTLYRSDHANEQAESEAQENLVKTERKAEEAAARLSACILARYHEEQIWSDKIRRMSTWGTWGLMGVNVLLFLVFQIGVEPWRRKRLVKGFEEKVMEALEKEQPATNEDRAAAHESQPPTESSAIALLKTEAKLDVKDSDTDAILFVNESKPSENLIVELETTQPVSQDPQPPIYSLNSLVIAIQDTFSSRQVTLRRFDVTAIALEAAAAGMVLTASIFMIFRPR